MLDFLNTQNSKQEKERKKVNKMTKKYNPIEYIKNKEYEFTQEMYKE
ncbi:hypothetical protein IJ596_02615 [bacterium]|nr:hypothetical protein [bacterium]